jgi:anti-sigma factor RsiW
MNGPVNGGHDRWEKDAAAYALDALQSAEASAFEEHLAGCTRCREDLLAMRHAVHAIAATPSPRDPPERVKQRVMATVRSEAAQLAAAGGTAGRQAPTGGASGQLAPAGGASGQLAPAGGAAVPSARRAWRRVRGRWPAWSLGAVAVAVAVVALLLAAGALNSGPNSPARTYAGTVFAPGASVSLRRFPSHAQLRVAKLPPPPRGRIYEVWLQRGGRAPVPTSTLFAVRTGSVAVRGNLHGVQAVLVTAEPRPNGSRAPTRAPIIVVRLT